MRSSRGEWTGKVLSTPTPYDVLRTVNVSRVPGPLRRSTVPSKTWMRSLSPSTTRTWTFTVSPGRKAGTPLRRCSASMTSIGFTELTLLAVTEYAVKDDGCRAPDREMVVVAAAADGLEDVVGSREHLRREPPPGAEDEEHRRSIRGEPRPEGGEWEAVIALACRRRHDARQVAGFALDVGDRGVEVVGQPHARQRVLSRLVVGGPGPRAPVSHDALDEPAQRRHR